MKTAVTTALPSGHWCLHASCAAVGPNKNLQLCTCSPPTPRPHPCPCLPPSLSHRHVTKMALLLGNRKQQQNSDRGIRAPRAAAKRRQEVARQQATPAPHQSVPIIGTDREPGYVSWVEELRGKKDSVGAGMLGGGRSRSRLSRALLQVSAGC